MKTKNTLLTVIVNLFNSVSTIIFNLLYINLVIRVYGSEMNGFLSSINQFVLFFSVLEGGISNAIVVALYNPQIEKNYKLINDILFTAKKYLNRVGFTITGLVTIGGALYLWIVDCPVSYKESYIILLISLLSTLTSICYICRKNVVLQSVNKEYRANKYTLIAKFISWSVSILLILGNAPIIFVFSCALLNNFINMFCLYIDEKKNYPYINYKGHYDIKLIKGSKDVIAQKIANSVFDYTDLILVSSCFGLIQASIYNLYNQIYKSVFSVFVGIIRGPIHSFGQLFAEKEKGRASQLNEIYTLITYVLSDLFFGVTGCVIVPFIIIYTRNIYDAEYLNQTLVLLFFSFFYFRSINNAYAVSLNTSGNFKLQNFQCIMGAIINIIVSLSLIKLLGVASIILGSVTATIFIVEFNMYQSLRFLNRNDFLLENIKMIVNYSFTICSIIACIKIGFVCSGFWSLLFFAIIVLFVVLFLAVVLNVFVHRRVFVLFVRICVNKYKEYKKY